MTTQIGQLVSDLRKAAGLSQRELAERSGMRQKSISNIENGKTTPHKASLTILERGLGVPSGTLVGPTTNPGASLSEGVELLSMFADLPRESRMAVLLLARELRELHDGSEVQV